MVCDALSFGPHDIVVAPLACNMIITRWLDGTRAATSIDAFFEQLVLKLIETG
jgi:hypothetical protein